MDNQVGSAKPAPYELFRFTSPSAGPVNVWRFVFDGSKYYVERHSIDALGGVVWIPEANFEASIINQSWIAALVVIYAKERASKKVSEEKMDITDGNF